MSQHLQSPKLHEELTCMAMICALPDDYVNFTSSILLLGLLDKITLQDKFHAKETNCQCHAAPTMSSEADSVLLATSRAILKLADAEPAQSVCSVKNLDTAYTFGEQ